ncbi:MAG: GGDEF domain-containing protein [Christensenellales bacterium]
MRAICDALCASGAICFEFDAGRDEVHVIDARGERVVRQVSQGAYGSHARALMASQPDSGSFLISAGSVWYARVAGAPLRYAGALLPAPETDMDRKDTVGYTCADGRDALTWRAERYRLLGEVDGVITFDYDPPTDTLVYQMCAMDCARSETKVRDYLSRLETCCRVDPSSRAQIGDALRRALHMPASCSVLYRADYCGTGYRWHRARLISVADASGAVCRVVGCADDIEDEIAERESLLRSALSDGVTGLYSRGAAQRLIECALAQPRGRKYDALFVIDIDDLKVINDTCGHLEGDAALTIVAEAIRAVFRDSDIKGRYGGDEFIVHMRAFTDRNLPRVVARRLMRTLDAQTGAVSCSVGATLIDEPAPQFDAVFARADKALYRAKRASKCCFIIYND